MTLDSRGFPWGFHIHSRGPVGGALERSPSKQPCPIEQDVDRPSPRYESRPWSALASRLEGRVAAQVAQNLLHFDQITSQPIEPSARLEPCEEAESYDTGVGELNQKKKKKRAVFTYTIHASSVGLEPSTHPTWPHDSSRSSPWFNSPTLVPILARKTSATLYTRRNATHPRWILARSVDTIIPLRAPIDSRPWLDS